MKYLLLFIAAVATFVSCNSPAGKEGQKEENTTFRNQPLKLTPDQANKLAELPLACYSNEYPNKLGQVLGGTNDLKEPHVLHPVFYGCFDWHSAVHAYWSMVKLMKLFPALDKAAFIQAELKKNITPENIGAEIAFFNDDNNKSYERTYGWAWLLKLSEELHTWDTPLARELEANLKPLTSLIVERLKTYLPMLRYPIRVGEHNNTAFALCFAWDYAQAVNDTSLTRIITRRAKDYYLKDENAPLSWEPNGNDFLSPCFEEVDLMRRVLTKKEFNTWIDKFLPQLADRTFSMEVGEVTDRKDGHLVHLDGLNFSRAWVLYGLAKQYPAYGHLVKLANKHIEHSLPNLFSDTYEGAHWLGTFAIYALGD